MCVQDWALMAGVRQRVRRVSGIVGGTQQVLDANPLRVFVRILNTDGRAAWNPLDQGAAGGWSQYLSDVARYTGREVMTLWDDGLAVSEAIAWTTLDGSGNVVIMEGIASRGSWAAVRREYESLAKSV